MLGKGAPMITFAIVRGGYRIYANFKLVGYMVPEGKYWYVYRLSGGRAIPQGSMEMRDARNLFEAIYNAKV